MIGAAALLLLGVVTGEHVLLEVGFDISGLQETPDGINATHILRDYLSDTNLHTLRHLATLTSGVPGKTPMRTAFLEFASVGRWTAFENTLLDRTHALHDLFWVHAKRSPWFVNQELTNKPQLEDKGGYVFGLKYKVRTGMQDQWATYKANEINEITTRLQGQESPLLQFREMTSKYFHGDYDGLITWEFDDMAGLSSHLLQN